MAVLRALIVACMLCGAGSAWAQEEALGVFQDWAAYKSRQNGQTVCYAASEPKTEQGDYTQRGRVWTMVINWPARDMKGAVRVIAGYPYKAGSEVTIDIDGKRSFKLFTKDDDAWAYPGDDAKLVAAMRAGGRMVIKGTSSRGTLTTDTYSLMGISNAVKAINQACGG